MASESNKREAPAPSVPGLPIVSPRKRARPSISKHVAGSKSAGAAPMDDAAFFAAVDAEQDAYIARLAKFVAIKGVSAEPKHRPDVVRAVNYVKDWCGELGGATTLVDLGDQTLPDGKTVLPLPPVLLAQFGDDPKKKTLVAYGHLDVQPAYKSDGWTQDDPFALTEVDGALFGRGASDDKGPVTAWMAAIDTHRRLGRELPVNLRFIFEGMEESGSVGLPQLVKKLGAPGEFLDPKAVDFLCISDNYWTGKTKPCLTHGLRGCVYFHLEIECSRKDMHSGVIGGSVHEAMTDLVKVMATLVDSTGKILIDGIHDDVAPVTDAERKSYEQVEFDIESYKVDAGVDGVTDTLLHPTKESILMHRWRYPTLSLHGIEGAFDGAGSKTVIPRKVKGKFSLRIVPNMHPEKVAEVVRAHVEREFAKLNSPNKMNLALDKAGFPWYRDPNVPNFRAAALATKRVHGVEPCLTREGGSIPITQVFEEVCDAACVLLPIGASDDGAHSQNEKIDRHNYVQGIKTLSCYIDELARLPAEPDAVAVAAAAAAAASRKASNRWRRRCTVDQTTFGCDCLECDGIPMSSAGAAVEGGP